MGNDGLESFINSLKGDGVSVEKEEGVYFVYRRGELITSNDGKGSYEKFELGRSLVEMREKYEEYKKVNRKQVEIPVRAICE